MTASHRRRVLFIRAGVVILASIAFVALSVSGAAPARAHANLVGTAPEQGARLDEAPRTITFTMDESVQVVEGSVQLIDARNTHVRLGEPQQSGDRTRFEVAVEEDLPDGTYLASMRAVSADTHVVAYSIRFAVGEAEPTGLGDSIAYGQAGGGWTAVIQVARVLGYAGAVLSFGLLIALAVAGSVSSRGTRAVRLFTVVAVTGSALVIAGALLNLTAQGPYSLGSGEWAALLRLDGFAATVASPFGVRLLVRMVVAVLLALWVWRRRVPWLPAAVPVAAGVVLAYTLAGDGHAAVGADAIPAIASTTAHVAAMAIWLGGIAALVVGGREAVVRRRWTVLATVCLVVVVATGVYQAVRRVYPVDSLWHTRYGLLLLAKVAGVAVIVAVAFRSRRWLRERRGGTGTLPVRAELATGLAVVALTSLLVSAVPARDDYGPPLSVTTALERGSLHVGADTTRRGPVTLTLEPDDVARETITGISATLSSEEAGVARLPVDLTGRDGSWTSADVIVPAPAEWTLSIVVDDGSSPVVTAVRYVVW